MQCAAVRTYRRLIKAPPHKYNGLPEPSGRVKDLFFELFSLSNLLIMYQRGEIYCCNLQIISLNEAEMTNSITRLGITYQIKKIRKIIKLITVYFMARFS
jgi:hypothetical protein